MAAILAILQRNGRPMARGQVSRAMAKVRSQGRNAEIVNGSGAWLASSGGEVVAGGDSRFTLVFDGRIDNRDELRAALGGSQRLPPDSDACLVMRAWERWQSRLGAHLIGDFAGIVWDAAEQRLFALRDHFGLRPLSYLQHGDVIAVASSPHIILALDVVAREPDWVKLADALVENYKDPERSFFRGILRLPPAHMLVADRSGVKTTRYWSLDPKRRIRLRSDHDYVDAAGELLGRAVAARLRGSGRVGMELSGGLDSSSIAVTMLDHLAGHRQLPAFTVVPETAWCRTAPASACGQAHANEEPEVRALCAMHPRIEPHFVANDGVGFDHGLDDQFRSSATLSRATIASGMWGGLYREAAAQGVTVMLNGVQGNATLSWDGRDAYRHWLATRQWKRLAGELKLVGATPIERIRRLMGLAVLPGAPAWVQRLYSRLRPDDLPKFDTWQSFSLIHPDFARRHDVDGRAQALGWHFLAHAWDQRQLRIDSLTCDVAQELGDFSFGLEMQHGIAVRAPMLDVRLVEWCLAIPEDQFFRNATPRWLIKRLMAGRLPPAMLATRREADQVADWHMRMTRDLPRIREQFEVLAGDAQVSSILDMTRIRRLLDGWPKDAPGRRDPLAFQLQFCLPHALTVGRFVRHLRGANL